MCSHIDWGAPRNTVCTHINSRGYAYIVLQVFQTFIAMPLSDIHSIQKPNRFRNNEISITLFSIENKFAFK